ncbi:hypothetical protein ABW21_db0200019 [Orbilia brochopaga]|nr:hypothetical protein ABW21_db0200019 [Drechslerella brochopaga]
MHRRSKNTDLSKVLWGIYRQLQRCMHLLELKSLNDPSRTRYLEWGRSDRQRAKSGPEDISRPTSSCAAPALNNTIPRSVHAPGRWYHRHRPDLSIRLVFGEN